MDRRINHRGHREEQRGKGQALSAIAQIFMLIPKHYALCALLLAVFFLCVLCGSNRLRPSAAQTSDLALPQEKHLRNVRQLTFGGENAEAYFSSDGKKLIFQSTRDGYPCDQIYEMNIDGSGLRKLSTGKGRTTCSYFFPDGKRYIYSSTHQAGDDCPPKPH